MNKFTPGPWIVKGSLFGEWVISSEFGVDGGKMQNGRQHIANSPSASSKRNPEYFAMFMANARLIASAPCLLEALESCRNELASMIDRHNAQDPSDGSWLYDHQTICDADNAIARAKGEQN
jgi:hypothetical protein